MSFILAEETALKDWLKGMTVSDEKVPVRPVQVWFGMPDVELRQQIYPYITIDMLDIQPANDRQHSGVVTDTTLNGTQIADPDYKYRYEIPVAYDLIYQVTTYSRHPRHDRAIIQQILKDKFPAKFGYLNVPDATEVTMTVRHMFLDEFMKRDFVEDGRRLFRNVFTIRIVSELDRFTADTATNIVKERLININPTHIPSNFDMV